MDLVDWGQMGLDEGLDGQGQLSPDESGWRSGGIWMAATYCCIRHLAIQMHTALYRQLVLCCDRKRSVS